MILGLPGEVPLPGPFRPGLGPVLISGRGGSEALCVCPLVSQSMDLWT